MTHRWHPVLAASGVLLVQEQPPLRQLQHVLNQTEAGLQADEDSMQQFTKAPIREGHV